MIDPRLLRDDPDRVRAAQAKRGLSDDVVDRALEADSARRAAIADFESRRAEQKASGALVAKAQGEEKQALHSHGETSTCVGVQRPSLPTVYPTCHIFPPPVARAARNIAR
jgi:seryl-tRNA synthetase